MRQEQKGRVAVNEGERFPRSNYRVSKLWPHRLAVCGSDGMQEGAPRPAYLKKDLQIEGPLHVLLGIV